MGSTGYSQSHYKNCVCCCTVNVLLPFADVDECREVEGVCYNGRCENTDGGFVCICPPGLTMTLDGIACLGM